MDGWLSYDHAEIPLDIEGITRISGKMGSGKSAILEAITYLITGKTIRQKDSVNDLCNKILDNGYDIKVMVETDRANEVIIQEVRGRKNNGLHFIIDGVDKRGKTDVDTRKRILKFLEITPTEFKAISVVGQNQAHTLVNGSDAERAQIIVDVFGLSVYDQYIAECKSEMKQYSVDKDNLFVTMQAKKEEYGNVKQMLENIEIKIIEADRDQLDTKIKKYEDRQEDIRNIKENIQSKLKDVDVKLEENIRYANAALDLSDAQKEIEQLIGTIKLVSNAKLDKQLPKLAKLEGTTYSAEQSIRVLEREIESTIDSPNLCPITNTECPVNVPGENKENILANIENKMNNVTFLITKNKKIINKVKKYKAILTQNTVTNTRITKLQNSIDTALRILPADWEQQDTSVYAEKQKKFENRITKQNDKLLVLSERIRTMLRTRGEIDANEETLDVLEGRETLLSTVLEDLAAQHDLTAYAYEVCAEALVVFKKLKLFKVDAVIKVLNKEVSNILQKISDDKYNIQISSQKMSADNKRALDKVSLIVSDGYKELPAKMWSGGQVTEISLAIILGTWKTATRLSGKTTTALWLDEVFGPIDQKAINRVFESVVDVCAEEHVSSVFIISHRDLDSRLFDNEFHAEMSNGISTITS